MNNLEWLMEHDTDAVRDALRCFIDGETIGCSECAYDKHRVDGVCMNSSEWLLAEHVDDESCNQVADQPKRQESPDCESDSREKLEADVYDFMELVWGAGGRFAKGLTEYTPEHYAEKCMKLLDRQASITSKEWCWTNDSLQEQVNMLTEQRDRWHDNWTERNVEYNDLADEYDELKAERDEWKAKAEEEKSDAKRYWENANRWGKQNAELKSERDALQRKLEILKEHGVEIVDAVAGGYEVYNEAIRERDKWKAKAEEAERAMNAAAGKWAKADAENRELRKMLVLDDGTVEDYTERADPLTALAHQKQLAEEWRDRCHNAEALCEKIEAERDELQKELDIANVMLVGKPDCDICDRTTLLEEIEGLTAESDELTDKIGEITDEASELMKKQPYTFDVHDVSGSLRTVGRYIDELTAERDEWKRKAKEEELNANGHWRNANNWAMQVDSLKRKLEAAQDVNERQDLEYVSLSREIGTLRAERDRYRDLCGKLLDAADEMRRVRDQFDAFTEVD